MSPTSHPAKRPTAETDQDENLEPISVRIATAVKLTGIGRSTLYELIGSGEIETVKIGRSTLILYRSLKRLILR
ncbi:MULTISPECIES: helix-turn-helix domain-containing protein [Sphingobium]|uniref:helix-turn-helix domain-containing protein n=1 Tax=Sphingobium TaxID=165695 RepID=UPI00159C3D8C|nr:helix-turn-helix domain-containing protein [Sphingobium sp. 15-1]